MAEIHTAGLRQDLEESSLTLPDNSTNPLSEHTREETDPPRTSLDLGEEAESADSPAKTGVKSALREFLETAALALLIFLAVRTFVMNYRVIGHSMQPNIHEGQYLLIDKLLYGFGESRRGDIVVLRPPNNPGEIYIKRVIGVAGDTVEIRNGQVIINERAMLEPWETRPYPTSNWGPGRVGQDEVFVLGDNRPGSRDSRYFGMLPADRVIGRAFISYWPPAEWATYPRYDAADLRVEN